MMQKTIDILATLYERLGKLAKTFETPQDVISRLLDFYKMEEIDSPLLEPEVTVIKQYNKLDIKFFPENLVQFKSLLLKEKQAWVLLHMNDGSKTLHQWNASRFTEGSNVLGNLRSGYLRDWRDKGIISADIAINRYELD
ncbi:MAG: hypothetical protein GQ582_05630 [Methyloprofundus sp.]|nr:hypothetical protein [Methyloprofundus sp.]